VSRVSGQRGPTADLRTNLHPQNVQASYPGCANVSPGVSQQPVKDVSDIQPTTSNTDEEPGAYSEANAKLLGKPPLGAEAEAAKPDSVEGKPGIIEGTELAPLGEEKLADDHTLSSAASGTSACKFINL
jgi:hypothetical protein